MLSSKQRRTKLRTGLRTGLIVAAMVSLMAFASLWTACPNCALLAHASEMDMSADPVGTSCPGTIAMDGHEWSDVTGACLDAGWDRAESAQRSNPSGPRLPAALPVGFEDSLSISRTPLASLGRVYIHLAPPAVPQTLLALKTLFQV